MQRLHTDNDKHHPPHKQAALIHALTNIANVNAAMSVHTRVRVASVDVLE